MYCKDENKDKKWEHFYVYKSWNSKSAKCIVDLDALDIQFHHK